MTCPDVWLHFAVPALATALLARAVWMAIAIERCTRRLLSGPPPRRTVSRNEMPWLVVLVPMLREQTLAQEAIAAFTGLSYPRDRAAVVVITTQREQSARAQHRDRLPALIAGGRRLTARSLRGLIPATRCEEVADEVNAAPPGQRLRVLRARFDAEPTTAEVVTALLADRPPGTLPVVHLHQPDVGGRKAGQLNFALHHLGNALGPLGWLRSRDAALTFAVVYDADAVPDSRTLEAFASAAQAHVARTGRAPALIQQQRLPLLNRRPFPNGLPGLLLTGEWVYQMRRSLGIERARIRVHRRLAASSRLPEFLRMWLRPMVYAVGCGMAVHLRSLHALGGFPEPMEDLGIGHRLSLLGAELTSIDVTVLDEPYTDACGLVNLHALAFVASARPGRHARAVAHLPSSISRPARAVLVVKEWADTAAWLFGAPLCAFALASSWWSGPGWAVVAAVGVLVHGPLTTARLLILAPALGAAVVPPVTVVQSTLVSARHPLAVVAMSPLQPFVRLAGPWRTIFGKLAGRHHGFGKTER